MYVTNSENPLYAYMTQRNEIYRAEKIEENSTTEKAAETTQQGNTYRIGSADDANSLPQKNEEAATLFHASQISNETSNQNTANSSAILENTNGKDVVDLDEYFGEPIYQGRRLEDIPILLPTKDNMKAIRQHTEERLQKMMKANGIPEAPSQISYDRQGQIQLPDDYAYKDEFMSALNSETGLAREVQTLAAMSSHFNAFQQIAQTGSTLPYEEKITLDFDTEGNLVVSANGKPLEFDQKTASTTSDTAEEDDEENANESNEAAAREWFLDYMQKTPEERYFESILRELGLTPEEYAALSQEEKLEVDKQIEERMKEDAEENTSILT